MKMYRFHTPCPEYGFDVGNLFFINPTDIEGHRVCFIGNCSIPFDDDADWLLVGFYLKPERDWRGFFNSL